MAFLEETAESASVVIKVADHSPLLKEGMSLNDRILYLKGIALAALLDDAEISVAESRIIKQVSNELDLTDEVTSEAFEIKAELAGNPSLQAEFLQELYSMLNTALRKNSFVGDVELLFYKDGKIKECVESHYRRLCVNLYGSEWEKDYNSKRFIEDHPVAARVADSCGKVSGYLAKTNLGYLVRRVLRK